MSDYTYAFENRTDTLEQYEWDNVWWEQTDKTDAQRILYIGDSISCNVRRVATEVSENTLLFDGLGTSKAVDNPYFCETVRLFAAQQPKRAAILFNNGLHGWHLDDETEYKQNYESIIKFLLEEFKGAPLILVLTTAVKFPERNARVVARNEAVSELARAYGLPVIDLYSATDEHRDLIAADGVHMVRDGYELLASRLVSGVKSVLD